MQVVIDGGESIEVLNDVKIFYDVIANKLASYDEDARLVVTGTHEGIIMDLEDEQGVIGTSSQTAQEIADAL